MAEDAAAAAPPAAAEKNEKAEEEKREPKLPQLSPELMKSTRLYELMILFDPAAAAAKGWSELLEWVKGLIEEKHGQHVLRIDKWADSRKLAYEIKGLKRGTYMLVWLRADPGAVKAIDRDLFLDERPIRHLTLTHEEEPPTVGVTADDLDQAAAAAAPSREDRGFGDRGGFGGRGGYGDRDRGDRGDRGDRSAGSAGGKSE